MKAKKLWVGLLALIFAAGTAFAQADGDKPKAQDGDQPKKKTDGDRPQGQDEKKKRQDRVRGAVPGVPPVKIIVEKLSLGEEVAKALQKKEAEAAKAFKELRKKAREGGGDRQALRKEFRAFRTKTIAAYRECIPKDKQEEFDKLVKSQRPQRKKKKDGADS